MRVKYSSVHQKRSGVHVRPDRSKEFVRRTILDVQIPADPRNSETIKAPDARFLAINLQTQSALAQCGGER